MSTTIAATERGWYVVHVQSGWEDKVRTNLEERIRLENLQGKIHQILIPTEDVVEVKKNKNYHFAHAKKKQYKLEIPKFCKACKKQTPHKESK